MTVYSQEEYLAELLRRQDAYVAAHPGAPGREWVRPLLTWFVRDDDQVEGVTVDVPPSPPPVAKPPRPDRRPEIRGRLARNRDRLAGIRHQLDALSGEGDPATVNLSSFARNRAAAAAGRRRLAQLDRDITRGTSLLATEAGLLHRIALDEARLARAEGEPSR